MITVALHAALALQVLGSSTPSVKDSVALARANDRQDSARVLRRIAHRVPVTPALERSAFRDPLARDLLLRARAARIRVDSTIASYDATAYQRLSVGLGFRQIGRDRLLFRTETATRVRWSRDVGAWVDLLGQRAAFPMARGADIDVQEFNATPLPYYPGRESLWIGGDLVKADVDVDPTEIVHPLAAGAEAYYKYATGDSLKLELGSGTAVRLRELRITARRPQWNLIVGSFWFDVASGQLVRAAYRLSVPMDIWQVAREEEPEDMNEIPLFVRPLITPMTASVEAITVEYGLFNGIWMPRLQALEAHGRASFMRVPVRLEERFRYASVNALDTTLSPIAARTRSARRDSIIAATGDSALADSILRREAHLNDEVVEVSIALRMRAGGTQVSRAQRDSIREEVRERMREASTLAPAERDSMLARYRRAADAADRDSLRQALLVSRRLRRVQCDTSHYRVRMSTRFEGTLRIAQRVPCDESVLAHSPELPPTLYDAGEQLFGSAERDELVKALGFGLQSGWGPQRPAWHYGLADGVFRYNRVEGVSLGVGADMQLGLGYVTSARVRYAFAARQPLAELGVSRSNGRRSVSLNVFRRISVSDDWGSPLSFGSSFAALLYARDEGFYYRSLGTELGWQAGESGAFSLRAFAERQRTAPLATRRSIFGGANDHRMPAATMATEADVLGTEMRTRLTRGLDPEGVRLQVDARAEVAAYAPIAGDASGYARAAVDAGLTRPLARRLGASIGLSAGGSAGRLTQQRLWRLGGLQSVRGQSAGTMSGDAFWMGHAELSRGSTLVKPVLFFDAGWAGPRAELLHAARPMRGTGLGLSILDGLVRFDFARGLYPSRRNRADLYVEARF